MSSARSTHTAWYFQYQLKPESSWFVDLAANRAKIVREKKPPFTTVLDSDFDFPEDATPEDIQQAAYRGRFYIDLDSDEPEYVIEQFKKLLVKLRDDYEVDLRQIELYATGGRGFHLLFPQEMFMEKPPVRGIQGLPAIYKEMAYELYVETVDMNIYSARRGRMWREPNIQRPNGKYKVQISVHEALAMDVAMYNDICSAPRYERLEVPPEFHTSLALSYSKAHAKMARGIANAKKNRNAVSLLQQFKSFEGSIPPTLSAVMRGETVRDGVGFQVIAMQLAIMATKLISDDENGMNRNKYLEMCEGLIQNHVGDGSRYGTPAKRRVELLRMFDYMTDNPGYTYTVPGIKSIIEKGTPTRDLDRGMAAVNEDGTVDDSEDVTETMAYSISLGVKVDASGIWKKGDEGGFVLASALGLTNPRQLVDMQTGEVHGYEVDVHIDGKPYGKPRHIGMDAFGSRNSFMKFTLGTSCSIGLTDAQIGALADIMRKQTENSGALVYTVRREGVDLITTPDSKVDIVWADQFGVSSHHQINYRLTGSMTDDLQFRTDLRHAPELIDTPESREFFDNLFHINTPDAIGRMLGFYMASFISQPIRHLYGKFPFLQVYGPAGSGKSETNRLLALLHYYKADPKISSALSSTKFVYEEMATCSGSIPFILDEYKPREMRKDLVEVSRGILRSNYNGDKIGKGSVTSSTGKSQMTLTSVSNRSPIVVIGEAIISQSALLERSIVVPLTKEGRAGQRDRFEYCRQHRENLSSLGRMCIDKAINIDLEGLRHQIAENVEIVRGIIGARADDNDRPIFNIAVLMTGLEFARMIMSEVYGDKFDADFARMKHAVVGHTETLIPKVMSEANKVLDTLAFLSRHEVDEKHHLAHGDDYLVVAGNVEMRLRNVYTKYARFKRGLGDEILYDDYEAFYSAMSTYTGVVDTVCPDSILKDTAQTTVFAFSQQYMYKEGVEEFNKV